MGAISRWITNTLARCDHCMNPLGAMLASLVAMNDLRLESSLHRVGAAERVSPQLSINRCPSSLQPARKSVERASHVAPPHAWYSQTLFVSATAALVSNVRSLETLERTQRPLETAKRTETDEKQQSRAAETGGDLACSWYSGMR